MFSDILEIPCKFYRLCYHTLLSMLYVPNEYSDRAVVQPGYLPAPPVHHLLLLLPSLDILNRDHMSPKLWGLVDPSVQFAGVQYEYNHKQTVYGTSTIRNI